MARVKRNNYDNNDIDNYKNLGEMQWQSALENVYSPGIDTVAVSPKMLSPLGMKRLLPRHQNRDKVMVVYDREYVFYRLFNLFVRKLGIVADGTFNDELYTEIVNGLREYSISSFERKNNEKLMDAATKLDKQIPGHGIEHWYELLKQKQGHTKSE